MSAFSGADWRIACGNCGTPARGPPDRYCEKLEGGRPPIGAAKQQEKAG
jgi:hypothetical protein